MPKINSTQFGSIIIDDQKYGQVLIVSDHVEERDEAKLEEVFGTSHRIGDFEIKMLLSNQPEIIVIGTGQSGVMRVTEDDKQALFQNCQLIIQQTPQAIKTFNKLITEGKRVNGLFHTTC